ncbi:MAG: hypothetical protein IJ418_19200 [Clostridia bacterium]|nr:hypothetical protein [Clostridia bacterium]
MINRNEKTRFFVAMGLAVVAVIMLLILRLTLIPRFDVLMYIGDAAAVLLVLTCVLSEIALRRSPLNGSNLSVQEKHDVVMQARERIRESEAAARKQLYRRYSAVTRQMVLVGALGILSVLGHVWVVGAVLGFVTLTMVFQLSFDELERFSGDNLVEGGNYPKLMHLIRDCADQNGIREPVKLAILPGDNAAIGRYRDCVGLMISAPIMSMMTASELRQLLNHEFAHLANEEKRDQAVNDRARHLDEMWTPNGIVGFVFSLPFRHVMLEFLMEYQFWRQLGNEVIERHADQASSENAQAMASMLAKLYMYSEFQSEKNAYDYIPVYSHHDFPKHFLSELMLEFREKTNEREGAWRERMACEIQSRSATHPVARERIKALGVTDYSIMFPDETDLLHDERQRFVDEADEMIWKDAQESFNERRDELYLSPMRTIQEWEQAGRPIGDDGGAAVISAFDKLGRIEEKLSLCRSLMETYAETPWIIGVALFQAGITLCERGDKEGLALLYHAMDVNHNAIDDGIDAVGSACCRFGWADDLEVYRARATEYLQRKVDHDDDCTLNPHDSLSANEMPEDVLASIVGFIRTHNVNHAVEAAYIVRKTVASGNYVYFVILDDSAEGDKGDFQDIADQLFAFLDAHPTGWQFMLDYDDEKVLDIARKVPGSIVYRDGE